MPHPLPSPSPAALAARLLHIVDRFADRRVLVMGDFIADEFIYGRVARISREAPVLILEYDTAEIVPGGAGNAASNVGALGARTCAVGFVGDDDMGTRMVAALHANVERRSVLARKGMATPTKTRVLAGGVHSAKQQVVRIDRVSRDTADAEAQRLFRRHVLRAAERCDAVLVSDYGAGLVSPSLVADVKRAVDARAAGTRGRGAAADAGARPAGATQADTRRRAVSVAQRAGGLSRGAVDQRGAGRSARVARPVAGGGSPTLVPPRRVPILIDSRYDLAQYRGLTACTPNEAEVEATLGIRIDDQPATIERAGRAMLDRTRHEIVLVTRGSHGMALFERGQPTQHLDIFGSDEIADVTGAGDTVIATMTLALASGASALEATRLANYAGGLVVMKRGTATVSADELRQAVRDDLHVD